VTKADPHLRNQEEQDTIMGYSYILLAEDSKDAVRQQLTQLDDHFYHFTLDPRLKTIKLNGLDPKCESPDSDYGRRDLRPGDPEPNAIRYCTQRSLVVGYRTALVRVESYDDSDG
jgi:hypothetical protein